MTDRTPPLSPLSGRARLVRSLTPPSLHARPHTAATASAAAALQGLSPPRHPVYARLRREAALPLAEARAEAAYCQRVADEDALCRLLDSTFGSTALAEADAGTDQPRPPRLLHSLSGSALRTARKHPAAGTCVSPLAPRLPKPPTHAAPAAVASAPVAVPQPLPTTAVAVATAAAAAPAVEPPPRSSSAPPLPWDYMT